MYPSTCWLYYRTSLLPYLYWYYLPTYPYLPTYLPTWCGRRLLYLHVGTPRGCRIVVSCAVRSTDHPWGFVPSSVAVVAVYLGSGTGGIGDVGIASFPPTTSRDWPLTPLLDMSKETTDIGRQWQMDGILGLPIPLSRAEAEAVCLNSG
ncbi:hypothetical protein LX32DRAFT_322950 [Colletotrichum zoysiae]|uniref:Uncharacterized protein n=1 Tax=Colletotrichum zoysiae TaxID=1216348 RepID=A0AAD9H168_9PEZI|nr:hypothetical protein LX32DRAFT_322950 [Colletotrichum zoysiae]